MPRRNNRRKAEYHKKTYIRKRDWRAFDAIESMRVKETPTFKTRQGRISITAVPHRGEVWFTDFGEFDNSSVQRGKRPAVIVSIDVSNEKSGTVTVIPLTSKIKKTWYIRVWAIDPTGYPDELEDTKIRIVETVKCLKCGNRMIAEEAGADEYKYSCRCGTTYNPALPEKRRWNFDKCECDR